MVNYMYWAWDGAVPKDICDYLIKNADWDNSTKGVIGAEDTLNEEYRKTDILWVDRMSTIGCIAQSYLHAANCSAGWNFDMDTIELMQIGRYSEGGHYDWHQDIKVPENQRQRKLSISILLNDPAEFEGGDLVFKGAEDKKIFTQQGTIVVFPSFVEHKVTPVTKGTRYTAVTWALGPSFR